MRFDISGKPKGVIAGALFGEFGVALFERFDEMCIRDSLCREQRRAACDPGLI